MFHCHQPIRTRTRVSVLVGSEGPPRSALCWRLHSGQGAKRTTRALLALALLALIAVEMSAQYHRYPGARHILGLMVTVDAREVPRARARAGAKYVHLRTPPGGRRVISMLRRMRREYIYSFFVRAPVWPLVPFAIAPWPRVCQSRAPPTAVVRPHSK